MIDGDRVCCDDLNSKILAMMALLFLSISLLDLPLLLLWLLQWERLVRGGVTYLEEGSGERSLLVVPYPPPPPVVSPGSSSPHPSSHQ
jgi:hypothetical protein